MRHMLFQAEFAIEDDAADQAVRDALSLVIVDLPNCVEAMKITTSDERRLLFEASQR